MRKLAVDRILRQEHAGCSSYFTIFRGQCEGCYKAARHTDSEGVPLCCECVALATVEAREAFDAEFEQLPKMAWDGLHKLGERE